MVTFMDKKLTREEAYKRYKEKKKSCKTVAQEVEMLTTDPEMIMLTDILKSFKYESAEKGR